MSKPDVPPEISLLGEKIMQVFPIAIVQVCIVFEGPGKQKAQVLVRWGRISNLSHIEHPGRIPHGFHLAHHPVNLIAIHQRDEFSPQTPIAMLPRKAPMMLADKQSRLSGNIPKLLSISRILKIQNRTEMQLARAYMPIIHAIQPQPLKHLPEIRNVCLHPLGSHRRILDNAHWLRIALHAAQNAQPRLPQVPDSGDILAVNPCAAISHSIG